MLALTVLVISCGKQNPVVSGSYDGEGEGRNGLIKVQVHLKDSVITGIDIVETSETASYAEAVYTDMRYTMIAENNINVDVMSGASLSSQGFLEAVGQALTSAGVDLKGKKIQAGEMALEETEQSYDVVIVGSGGAGLSAAVEAYAQGATNIVILEKMTTVGGNTLVSAGTINAAETSIQKALGIDDTVEIYVNDTLTGGDNLANPQLVQYLAESSADAVDWLQNNIGVPLLTDTVSQIGGHSKKRSHNPIARSGEIIVQKLKQKVDSLKIPIKTGTGVTELIVENGRVTGVIATNTQGQTLTVSATKGVILATGGFGANMKMREQYYPEYGKGYLITGTLGTTGDGVIMSQKIGADVVNMDQIQVHPTTIPTKGWLSRIAGVRFNGASIVNQEGNRFVEEVERRDVISKAIIAQTGSEAFVVWTDEVSELHKTSPVHKKEFDTLTKLGLLTQGNTIEEAVKLFNISKEGLEATVKKVNEYAATGIDSDFNNRVGLKAMTKGPYYIQKIVPSVHYTMGGLKIDKDTHVIDKNGAIIPGLYAAGEVTGGIHGSNRLGGNALTDIIVFGRTAGKSVAKGL